MPDSSQPDSIRASRAIGAMFYGTFGGAWVGYWAWNSFAAREIAVGLVAAVTLGLLAMVYRRYNEHKLALEREPRTAEKERRDRWFHIINGGQWVVILVVMNVLRNVGMAEWVIPSAMFVIGLHFIPLARLFSNPAHYVTGGALMAVAAGYPFLAGPASAVGALLAGLVLWGSAAWAIRG